MAKILVKLFLAAVLAFVAGTAGGFLAFLYLSGLLPFDAKNIENMPPVRVTEKQETTIQENKALKDAAAKVGGIAIGVKITNSQGTVSYGSGLIFTSDGMAAVPYNLFSPGTSAQVTAGGKTAAYQVLKRDQAQNLVILKLESANWPTAGFYQLDSLNLGERVFLVGVLPAGGNFVSEGIVRDFSASNITTDIYEKSEAQGSPVFDIEGNIMGMADVARSGQVSVIPIDAIKGFSGL